MGEYRFSIYGKWSLSIGVSYEYGQILVRLPFMVIHVSINKYAKGYNIFNKFVK